MSGEQQSAHFFPILAHFLFHCGPRYLIFCEVRSFRLVLRKTVVEDTSEVLITKAH